MYDIGHTAIHHVTELAERAIRNCEEIYEDAIDRHYNKLDQVRRIINFEDESQIDEPDCYITRVDPAECEITGVQWPDCFITRVDPADCEITGVQWPDCYITRVDPADCEITGVQEPDCYITKVDRADCEITGVHEPDSCITGEELAESSYVDVEGYSDTGIMQSDELFSQTDRMSQSLCHDNRRDNDICQRIPYTV